MLSKTAEYALRTVACLAGDAGQAESADLLCEQTKVPRRYLHKVLEDGFYRRAGAVPMSGGCVSCHGGFANKPSKTEKFAGLVISIPVVSETPE